MQILLVLNLKLNNINYKLYSLLQIEIVAIEIKVFI